MMMMIMIMNMCDTHMDRGVAKTLSLPFPKKSRAEPGGGKNKKVRYAWHIVHTPTGSFNKGLPTYSRRYCTYLVSGDDEWLRK